MAGRTVINQHRKTVLAIPLTSRKGRPELPPFYVGIAGLSEPSFAVPDQTRCLDKARFIKRLGAASEAELSVVLIQLSFIVGLE